MPLILQPSEYDQWLHGARQHASELLRPFEADAMHIVRTGENEKSDPAGASTVFQQNGHLALGNFDG